MKTLCIFVLLLKQWFVLKYVSSVPWPWADPEFFVNGGGVPAIFFVCILVNIVLHRGPYEPAPVILSIAMVTCDCLRGGGGFRTPCPIPLWVRPCCQLFIPRRSWRDIVLASSMRPSVHSFRPSFHPSIHPSVHTFCLSGTISQYLLVRFDSFLVQIISTIDSQYPISLVKIDPLTLELLPLF